MSPSPEIVVVFNPRAGTSQRAQLEKLLARHFSGRAVELCESESDAELPSLLAPWLARGVKMVIAAGGDGTISAVASVLAETGVPLGILPLGTGNVLVRELDLPTRAHRAAQLLAGPYALRALDVMRVAGRAYLLAVGVGLSAHTMRRIRRVDKQRFGRSVYVGAFILSLFGLRNHDFEVEVDGRLRTARANEVIALNAGILGYKALRWGPDIRPDDGHLDLCFVRSRTALDYLRLLTLFFLRQQKRASNLNCVAVSERIIIRAPEGLTVQGDGEVIGETPIEITLLPAALQVAVSP